MLRLEEKAARVLLPQAHFRASFRLLLFPSLKTLREKQPASCGHPHLSCFPDVSLPFQDKVQLPKELDIKSVSCLSSSVCVGFSNSSQLPPLPTFCSSYSVLLAFLAVALITVPSGKW